MLIKKKEIYKFNDIQRQSLSHNLYNIFEGIRIRQMNVKLDDIKPFIPFARDSEGGITSFFKLAKEKEKEILFLMEDLQRFYKYEE